MKHISGLILFLFMCSCNNHRDDEVSLNDPALRPITNKALAFIDYVKKNDKKQALALIHGLDHSDTDDQRYVYFSEEFDLLHSFLRTKKIVPFEKWRIGFSTVESPYDHSIDTTDLVFISFADSATSPDDPVSVSIDFKKTIDDDIRSFDVRRKKDEKIK